MTSCHSQPNPIILKTAVTSVNNGEITKKANIFIDEGSSLSYITTQLAKELCIKPHCSKTVRINTFGGASSNNTYPVGSVNIMTDEGAISIDTLIKDVIVTPLDRNRWADSLNSPHITSLQLADDFSQPQFPVQILIGLDAVWQFLKPDVSYGYPTAQASSLGYLISGRLFPITDSTNDSQAASQCFAVGNSLDSFPFDDSEWYSYTRAKDLEVHSKVADFLKIETLGIEDPRDTSQEDDFLERFQSKITYRDGTYFAPLPWLDNHPPLPSNFNLAHNRLQQVKKRLLKLDVWKPYASVIADQIDKGYVETVPANEDPLRKNDAHYLSHFFVIRPESETTPIRVVFAANAGHISLNHCSYTGPCLLRSSNTIIYCLLSPVLVPAKKLISSLWDKGFDWDEVLPDELQQQYNQIATEIEAASAFVTSRYLDFDKTLPVEMNVFCDACPTTAAGCCVFFVQNEKVRFIGSKVKLSSSKHA